MKKKREDLFRKQELPPRGQGLMNKQTRYSNPKQEETIFSHVGSMHQTDVCNTIRHQVLCRYKGEEILYQPTNENKIHFNKYEGHKICLALDKAKTKLNAYKQKYQDLDAKNFNNFHTLVEVIEHSKLTSDGTLIELEIKRVKENSILNIINDANV